MEEDFYIENNSPIKITIIIILTIGLILGSIYYYKKIYLNNYIKLNTIEIELGEEISTNIKDYIKCNNYSDYTLNLDNVLVDDNNKTISTGEYSYKIEGNNTIKKGKIIVKDTTKPIVTVQPLTIGLNEEYNVSEFVTECKDLSSPCKVDYEKEKDTTLNKNAGEYTFNIVVSDMENNKTTKEVKLIVKENYSYKDTKEKDLEYNKISNEESNWNKTYTYKFDKALDTEEEEFDEKIKAISLDEYIYDKEIKDKELIIIYNKYDYAIGVSIKLTFTDGTTTFVTSQDIKENNQE